MIDNDMIPKWIPAKKVVGTSYEGALVAALTLMPCDVCGFSHDEFNQPCCYCPAQPIGNYQ